MVVDDSGGGAAMQMRADHLDKIRQDVLGKWTGLQGAVSEKKKDLLQQLRYHKLIKEQDELIIWITDKLQIANDECYKDSSNLKGKQRKHQELLDEMKIKEGSVLATEKEGKEYVGEELKNSSVVEEKSERMRTLWDELVAAMEKRGRLIEVRSWEISADCLFVGLYGTNRSQP
eukprot:sb/3472049/